VSAFAAPAPSRTRGRSPRRHTRGHRAGAWVFHHIHTGRSPEGESPRGHGPRRATRRRAPISEGRRCNLERWDNDLSATGSGSASAAIRVGSRRAPRSGRMSWTRWGRAGTEAAHRHISDEGALRREPRLADEFQKGARGCAAGSAGCRGARRQPRAIDWPTSMAVVASRAAPSDVAPLAYGVRVAETRGRDRRARRSRRATRARRCNLPAFSSPRRGADEYPDTRCD